MALVEVGVEAEGDPGESGAALQGQAPHGIGEAEEEGEHVEIPAAGIT